MTVPDDLSALEKKPFADAVVKFEELLAQGGRAFLIGAGCSKCAGLPLTTQLTENVLSTSALDTTTKDFLLRFVISSQALPIRTLRTISASSLIYWLLPSDEQCEARPKKISFSRVFSTTKYCCERQLIKSRRRSLRSLRRRCQQKPIRTLFELCIVRNGLANRRPARRLTISY